MKKFDDMKKWAKDHKEALQLVAIGTGTAVVTVGIAYISALAQRQIMEGQAAKSVLDSAQPGSQLVFKNEDGGFTTVTKQ